MKEHLTNKNIQNYLNHYSNGDFSKANEILSQLLEENPNNHTFLKWKIDIEKELQSKAYSKREDDCSFPF